MKHIKRLWVWCKRIRHLNGFGVQSPFAFSFIQTVVYRRLPANIRRQLALSLKFSPYNIVRSLPGRTRRLLYKAARHNDPLFAIYIEKVFTGGIYYFSEGCQSPLITLVEEEPEEVRATGQRAPSLRHIYHGNLLETLRRKLQEHSSPDLIYLDLNVNHSDELCELLLRRCHQKSMLIAGNIHENKTNLTLWKKITEDKRTGISFDLYEAGIVLFDRHYHRQHYIVNFEGLGF